jgi:metal-responsive CopG/Arc/MetJ family transcriptional regulator
MAKKATHGGKRKGAGRPPKEGERTVVIAASVPESLAGDLDSFAKAKGWTRSKAVTEALRGLLKRTKGA